jgi:hypothetical protein
LSVQARLVPCSVSSQPDHQPLVRAAPAVFNFAGPPFSLIRTRLYYVHDAPQFTRIAELVIQVFIVPEESQAGKIGHHSAGSQAHEYVDPSTTAWADDVRSPDRDFLVRQIKQYTTL